ncbi:MAG TPA: hypothetical protein VFJ82_20780 [Longimicrobium sp.]|nr:hypothetical protein [Longimicrobium sp.]
MKMRMMMPVLAVLAITACGGRDDDADGSADTTGTATGTVTPMDTTATMVAPPAAPMAGDSMGAMTDTTGGTGANQQDTLVKVDSTKKM